MKTSPTPAYSAPSSTSAPALGAPDKKEVARVAYELWQRHGRPVGRDELIWLEAERLIARGGKASSRSA